MQTSTLKRDYVAVLIAAGVLYGLTVAPGALWQDNGMAQVRVLKHDYVGVYGLALAHPLFYLLAQMFQFLPFTESAFKTNLVAAVCGVVTVANIYLLVNWLLVASSHRRLAAILSAVGLMLAHTFWQHAALAEVYTVSTVILTFELLALVRFVQTGRIGWWLAVCFLNGLECSNHVLALITLASFGIWSLFIMLKEGKKLPAYWIIPGVLLWVIGCLPYEVFGLHAWQAGEPLNTVLHSMLFGQFQSQVLNMKLSLGLLFTTIGVIGLNFATPNLLLIPAGILAGRKKIESSLFFFFLLTTILHLGFAVRYPVRDQYTFFIMSVLFLAVWLGIGAAWVLEWWSSRARAVLIVFALLPPLLYAVLPGIVHCYYPKFAWPPIPYRDAATFFLHPWKSGYDGADRLTREVFALAGPDAIILVDSTSSYPFLYHQLAHGKRTDIRIVSDLYERMPEQDRIRKLTEVIELNKQQVWVVRPYPVYCPQWILDHFETIPNGPIWMFRPRAGMNQQPSDF